MTENKVQESSSEWERMVTNHDSSLEFKVGQLTWAFSRVYARQLLPFLESLRLKCYIEV